MHRNGRYFLGAQHRGFTLMEIIIVVLIIALFAGMIIPRMSGLGKRTEQLVADKIGDLLSAFGYRDSIASGSTAIEYSESDRTLVLLTLKTDPIDPDEPPVWSRDYLAPTVKIPLSISFRAMEDGKLLPDSGWSIIAHNDGTRPKIELEIEGDAVDTSITLDPWATGPYVIDNTQDKIIMLPDAFDLDAAGQDREPW